MLTMETTAVPTQGGAGKECAHCKAFNMPNADKCWSCDRLFISPEERHSATRGFSFENECERCGQEFKPGEKFCSNCGSKSLVDPM